MDFDLTINSLYICVKDMNRAIKFYEDFLCQPVEVRDEVFSIFVIKASGSAFLITAGLTRR